MDPAVVITTGIATVSALVALAALHFTRQQAEMAERQTALQERIREESAQPYVWADIRMDARQMHLMKLVIHNEGPTVAKDVVVSFDPGLPRSIGGEDVRDEYTLVGMPPGRHVEWNLNLSPDWIHGELPKCFTVTVTANGPYGPVEPLVYVLDVDEYRRASASPEGTLHGVSECLKELTAAIKAQR
jgi:hypothetical protein